MSWEATISRPRLYGLHNSAGIHLSSLPAPPPAPAPPAQPQSHLQPGSFGRNTPLPGSFSGLNHFPLFLNFLFPVLVASHFFISSPPPSRPAPAPLPASHVQGQRIRPDLSGFPTCTWISNLDLPTFHPFCAMELFLKNRGVLPALSHKLLMGSLFHQPPLL